jgi:hypothetical protein
LGTSSDINGEAQFGLKIFPKDSIIRISSVNYQTIDIKFEYYSQQLTVFLADKSLGLITNKKVISSI